MSNKRTKPIDDLLRSKIYKYINFSLINYNLQKSITKPETIDLDEQNQKIGKKIKSIFTPDYDSEAKIDSLLTALNNASLYTEYDTKTKKDIKFGKPDLYNGSTLTVGSWNFSQINKEDIKNSEDIEINEIPELDNEKDKSEIKNYIILKTKILNVIFLLNKKANFIREKSKNLLDFNEKLLGYYLNFDQGNITIGTNKIDKNAIELIDKITTSEVLLKDLNEIPHMRYPHKRYLYYAPETIFQLNYNIFDFDINNGNQSQEIDDFINEKIQLTKNYKENNKNKILEHVETLEFNMTFFKENNIDIKDEVRQSFDLIEKFYNNHIEIQNSIKEIKNISFRILRQKIKVKEIEEKISKILAIYSSKSSKEKLKEQIISSLNNLNDEKLLENLSELFDNNNLKVEETIDYIIAEILQSITTSTMTSDEIIDFMLVHKNLLTNPTPKIKILTNITNINDKSLFIKKEILNKDQPYNHRFGLIKQGSNVSNEYFELNEIIYGNESSDDQSVSRIVPDFDKREFNKLCPLMSYIMVLDPAFRIGKRNELELSVFLNSLSTIELSKSTPYFNATFILPNEVVKNGKIYKTASITQFLNGSNLNNQKEQQIDFKELDQSLLKNDIKGTKSNFNLFTMPQTLNNFEDIYVGRKSSKEMEIIKRVSEYSRSNYVHDITRPFMTLKSFSIDVAPTQGLLSFKTGKVSLVIHDRTRMVDIAPFIKPDMFGVIGAELILSYGWSNVANDVKDNYLGNFINSLKTTEKYIITNSSFNVTKNGEVNVDLSIAMKGPIDIKNTVLTSDTSAELNLSRLKSIYNEIVKLKNNLLYPNGPDRAQFIEIKEELTEDIINKIIFGKSSKDFIESVLSGELNRYKAFIDSLPVLKASTNTKAYFDNCFKRITNSDFDKSKNTFISILKNDFIKHIEKSFGEYYVTNVYKGNIFPENFNFSKIASSLLANYYEFFKILNELIVITNKKNKKTKKLVSKIMKGIGNVDPFFDKEWSRDFKNVIIDKKKNKDNLQNISNIISISDNTSDTPDIFKDERSNYISLGMVISSLIGVYLAKSGSYDDVQIISYNANKNAGLMSNRNISSLLIPRKELEDLISEIINTRKKITLEGIISKIIQEFIATKNQVTYGLSDLIFDEIKKDATRDSIDKRLLSIDTYLNSNTDSGTRLLEFEIPKIKMLFDTFVKKEEIEKTILRITLYDDNDNPYKELSSIFTESNQILKYAKEINRIKATKGKKSKEFKDKSTQIFNKLLTLDPPIIERKGNKHVFINDNSIIKAKSEIKKLVPSVTYGTQNSGIIDANVTTVNESNLNAVFLTRNERETGDLKGLKVSSDIDFPLQILPSKASVTMFGCPFINFAQYIFLDFETNTTLDNFYAVTGINHNLSPGNFTTSLTLSYGDAYGKYISSITTLKSAFNELLQQKETINIEVSNIIKDYKSFKINDGNVFYILSSEEQKNPDNMIDDVIKNNDIRVVATINSAESINVSEDDKKVIYQQKIILTGEVDGIGKHLGSIIFIDKKQGHVHLNHYIIRTEKKENVDLISNYLVTINLDLKVI